jgi:hypothetical protein
MRDDVVQNKDYSNAGEPFGQGTHRGVSRCKERHPVLDKYGIRLVAFEM